MNLERMYNGWTAFMAHVIGLRDPVKAMRFMRQRRALLSYAAATRKGPNARWNPKNKSADEYLRKDWPMITARARELARDSAHVAGALERICNNVIFTGIRPQAQMRVDSGGRLDKERNNRIEDHFRRWAEHPRVAFYEKQELALRHCWVDGEILVHYFESLPLLVQGIAPLGIELLEADYIDSSVNGDLPDGNRAVRGVEYDAAGFPVAYHLFTEHPGDLGAGRFGRSLHRSVRVPAERVTHVYAPKRASQSRGVSWLSSVIMGMHDFDEYQNSERIAARLMSAFAFFVETATPEGMDPSAWGGQVPGQGSGVQGGEIRLPDFVDPGRIQIMPPGTNIKSQGFERPGVTYEPYTKTSLRGSSCGVGMSYEAFSNDYTDASFSSARSASLEERRGYQKQQAFLNRRLNTPVWNLWSQFLYLAGLDDSGPQIPVLWQAPGWPWVDPRNDAAASKLELEMGTTSRRRIAASRGQDLDEIMDELEEERAFFGQSSAAKNKEGGDAQTPQE